MRDLNFHLQQLRVLTHQVPSLEAWAELWHTLDNWPDDESVAVALDYVRPTWQWPATLGMGAELITVSRALGAARPEVREAAESVLKAHPPSRAIREMARQVLVPREASSEERLARVFDSPVPRTPLDEVDEIYAGVDPALIDTIEKAMDETEWGNHPWEDHVHHGRVMMVVVAKYLRPRIARGERWGFFDNMWRKLERLDPDDPMHAWLLIDLLSRSPGNQAHLSYHGHFSTKPRMLVEPLCHLLITGGWSEEKEAIKWLADKSGWPEVFVPLLYGLSDQINSLRNRSLEGLIHLPPSFHMPATLMLQTASNSRTVSLARLLERVPDPAWIAPLGREMKRKRPAKCREALGKALLCAQIAEEGLDRDPDDLTAASTALMKRLRKVSDETIPPFLPEKLGKLRLVTGKAIPSKSLRWFVRRLSTHRFERSDAVLEAIRPCLDEGDMEKLSDSLHKAFVEAGRPRKESFWIIHAQGLLGTDRHLSLLAESINEDGRHKHDERKAMGERSPHILSIFRRRRSASVRMWMAYWSRFSTGLDLILSARRFIEDMTLAEQRPLSALIDRDLPVSHLGAKRTARLLHTHLSDALAVRKHWSLEAWRALLVSWPLGLAAAQGLLFEADDSGARHLFRVDGQGEVLGLDGTPIALSSAARVCLPHPLDLSDEALGAGRAALKGTPKPPFDQLGRGGSGQRSPSEALSALPRKLLVRPLHLKMVELGYEITFDKEYETDCARRHFDQDFEITLKHGGYHAYEVHSYEHRYHLEFDDVIATQKGELVPWDKVPARICAEITRDLKVIRRLK